MKIVGWIDVMKTMVFQWKYICLQLCWKGWNEIWISFWSKSNLKSSDARDVTWVCLFKLSNNKLSRLFVFHKSVSSSNEPSPNVDWTVSPENGKIYLTASNTHSTNLNILMGSKEHENSAQMWWQQTQNHGLNFTFTTYFAVVRVCILPKFWCGFPTRGQ